MVSPSPVPAISREALLCTRKNLSNTCGRSRAGMPIPVSVTRTVTISAPSATNARTPAPGMRHPHRDHLGAVGDERAHRRDGHTPASRRVLDAVIDEIDQRLTEPN